MILAHVSDLHLNGSPGPRARLVRALSQAARARADHLLVTGDLTDVGMGSAFDELAQTLATHAPMTTTVIPGNHDGTGPGFGRVFGAPAVADLGACLVVPLDTRYRGRAPAFWALGEVGSGQLAVLERLTRSPTRPVLVAMHHNPDPPQGFGAPLWHAVHGLADRDRFLPLLARSSKIHAFCGHGHVRADRGRVHAAAATIDHPEPLRLYRVSGAQVLPAN
jgi:3',5'-cyclic-AMP phosphodiesterase